MIREQCGGLGCLPWSSGKSTFSGSFDPPKTSVIPEYPREIGVRTPPPMPKSADAQVPYIKWCRTMHAVGPLNHGFPTADQKTLFNAWLVESLIPNLRIQRAIYTYIEKTLRLTGPMQFKAMLFKGQLCSVIHESTVLGARLPESKSSFATH